MESKINMTELEKASTLSEFLEAAKPHLKMNEGAIKYNEEYIKNDPYRFDNLKRGFLDTFEIIENTNKNDSKKIEKANIPLRFMESRLSNFPENVRKSCEDFITGKTEGLFIHGDAGTGKTHLAIACIFERILTIPAFCIYDDNYRIQKPKQGYFKPVSDLFLEIRNTFNSKTKNEQEMIDNYSDDDRNKWSFLVMDDLGVEKQSEWVQQTLYSIIDRRYRNMERTIITSNLTLGEISNNISDRIASRISEMCKVIHLKGKDRRIK